MWLTQYPIKSFFLFVSKMKQNKNKQQNKLKKIEAKLRTTMKFPEINR